MCPTPAKSSSVLKKEEKKKRQKRRRRRKQKSQKNRKLLLRGKTTLPFPEQFISHTDILLLLYLPTQICPWYTSSCTPAAWSCHSAGALKGESFQRAEPRNHYTLIHASSIASLQSKVRQNMVSITPCLFWK